VRLLSFLLLAVPALYADEPSPEELLESGHFLRVRAVLTPVVDNDPGDGRAVYNLSKAEGALGNLEFSLKLAEKAVAIDDQSSRYHVQLAAACGRLAQASGLLKQLGYARRAKKELDAALQLDPANLDALYGLALFYYAAPSFVGGDKQKALDSAEAMIRIDPVRGYLAQGRLANERKDPVAEEAAYKKALEANPDYYEAKATLANFYLTRDVREAIRLATEARDLDPGRVDAWKVLVQAYIAKQCWDEVLTLLAEAREAVPDDLAYYYSAALALEDAGRFLPWAAEFIDTYMSASPEGNEPTLTEASKAAKRIASATLRAGML
jgi:tetratricopeptide (TPR) repeat protein